MANIEITPEQKTKLEALRDSMKNDTNNKAAQKETGNLDAAINKNDQTDMLENLRALESRLASAQAAEKHQELLRNAQLAFGGHIEDADTQAHRAVDAVKSVTVDPLLDLAATYVPGAQTALDAAKPITDGAKEKYASLPTALRMPILGAAIGAGSWVLSYIPKGVGWAFGLVKATKVQEWLESLATGMRTTGKAAAIGGGILGLGSFIGGKYTEGAFDSTLDSLKSKPTSPNLTAAPPPPGPSTQPPAAPPSGPSAAPNKLAGVNLTYDELNAGTKIDGKNVRLLSKEPLKNILTA